MKIYYIIYIVFFILLSCISSSKNDSEIPIIDIEKELGNFQISRLSTFASSIRYVRLETGENFLVTNSINNIYLEDNKIFIQDEEPYLKVFDAKTGKYLYNIGSKGQGPGELPYLYTVNINPFEKKILLCWGNIVHHFDFDGTFLGRLDIPFVDSLESIRIVAAIDEHRFAGAVRVQGGENQKNLVIIFDDSQEIIGSLKCYENPIQPTTGPSGIIVWSPFDQEGLFYRANRGIRYFRGFTDTVFTYKNEAQMFVPFYVIDYGKHKSTLNFTRGAENPDLIKVASIKENERYIYIDFDTTKASPEPYEDEIYRGGQLYQFINHSISGIFDKQERKFHFLLQPIPGIRGLDNDIDNGIPFFVRGTSSNNQLIDYYHAHKFLENAQLLSDPSNSFTTIIEQISEEDNPIIIIAE